MRFPLAFLPLLFAPASSVAGEVSEQAPASPLELVRAAEARRIATIERVAPSVVCLLDLQERGGGSGVLIDPQGYGLTNCHVVTGLLKTRKGWGGLADGVLYPLEVLGIDITGDVAMFRLIPPKPRFRFPFAELGDSDAVQVGDTAIAMGNPFSLSEDYTPTVTVGIVTGIHRYQWGVGDNLVYSDCIQTDAPINPGNSGGPLFNLSGKIIGINGRISVNTRGRYNVGFGFAISSNQIKRFIPALRAGLLARHGTWQAAVQDHRLETGAPSAVRFSNVRPDGPAYQAGVRAGDKLLAIDGVRVTSANHVASILGTYPAKWPVRILIERDGRPHRLVVRLEPVEPDMRFPFEVDREVNRREVRRVLRSFGHAVLGDDGSARPGHWKWIADRRYHPSGDGSVRAAERFAVSQSGDGPIRMQQIDPEGTAGKLIEFDDHTAIERPSGEEESYDLPPDTRMVLAALYVTYRRLLEPVDSMHLTDVAHEGADLIVDAVGNDDETARASEGASVAAEYALRKTARAEARGSVLLNALSKPGDQDEGRSQMVEVIRWPLGETAVAYFAFDIESHLLNRITLSDPVSGNTSTVYLLDYQDVGGLFLPARIEVRGHGFSYCETLSEWEISP